MEDWPAVALIIVAAPQYYDIIILFIIYFITTSYPYFNSLWGVLILNYWETGS